MPEPSLERARDIKLLVLDVDGVLTDGSLLVGPHGEELKRFHVRDGTGIKAVQAAGLDVAIISSRYSAAVEQRMAELGVSRVLQGAGDKLAALQELVSSSKLEFRQVACIGDDLGDVPMMQSVGLAIAVADAHQEAKSAAHYETAARGGRGAVREVCDLLIMTRESPE